MRSIGADASRGRATRSSGAYSLKQGGITKTGPGSVPPALGRRRKGQPGHVIAIAGHSATTALPTVSKTGRPQQATREDRRRGRTCVGGLSVDGLAAGPGGREFASKSGAVRIVS